eukprot:c46895_g1_i1.p1 GENE.c46895_g1_i1~~c46895_g1_i1.p1  ORF type:complete len:214 (+),score=60.18 c46895_g1_i1:36-644(+)
MLGEEEMAILRAKDWAGFQAIVHDHPHIVQSKDENGRNPLHFVSRTGDAETVKVLLQHGADPNAQDDNGWTALHSASRRGHSGVAELLLASGALCNLTDESGWTALMVAVNNNATEVVKVLLNAGADVTILNEKERTARDIGVICEHHQAVEMIDQEVRRRKAERLRAFLMGTLRRNTRTNHTMVLMLPVDVLGVIASLVCE